MQLSQFTTERSIVARSFTLAALAAALALAPIAASCQQIAPPHIAWQSAKAEIPFDLFRGNRVVAAGTVNGQPVEFVLDTGAGVTTIDRNYARQIGLPAGRKIQAQGAGGVAEADLVSGINLTIGGLRLENVTAAVIDLSAVAAGIGRPMPVILGRELFDNAIITLDWESGRMAIADPASFTPPPAARQVALGRRDHRFNTIPVAVEGLPPVTATLDLGNGGTLTLPKSYWSKQPQLDQLRYAQSRSGGVGGLHGARMVTLGRIEVAGEQFDGVPASLSEDTAKGAVDDPNAGIGLLKPFKVTMDLGHNRLFLERIAKQPKWLRDRSGLRTELHGDHLLVIFVSPQSPAAAARIKTGHRIVAVNGQSIEDQFYQTPMSDWSQRAAGEEAHVTLASGTRVKITLADYY